jgi:hypothetical protein
MFTHKKIIITLLFTIKLFIIGCAASYAPENYLPGTSDVPHNVYGGWLTLTTEPDSLVQESKWMMYGGEFIAVDDSVVFLLYDSLYLIPRRIISESILELDEKNTTTYGLWVLGGSLLTISNGYYAGITLPLWLAAGIPTVAGESARDRYEMEYPDEIYWSNAKKFSRFPQGVKDIDLTQIKPYTFSKK